jgi:hypothetical protein
MICLPCARSADIDQRVAVADGTPALGHSPEVCRDDLVQPSGCACAHKPAGSAIEQPAVTASGQED